jgi:hypothetical protein
VVELIRDAELAADARWRRARRNARVGTAILYALAFGPMLAGVALLLWRAVAP